MRYKILLAIYQFFRSLRYNILQSTFGITVHCKHTPTCGTYTFKQIEKNGLIIGIIKSLKRVLTCW
ncbi:MAG: membrane protein insertion efficiency factor YidD [Pseudomonadales bacterium]|nr:membrane protein insertion efficiency factor YidD [Pseudomonadales bacterium]